MATVQQQLTAVGFTKLPELDPNYFLHRAKIGFLLLLNEKHHLSYHVFTYNAHTCLFSANKLINGEYADRARDLRRALQNSVQEDWEVYFRPNGLYPGLRNEVKALLEDYQSLNTQAPRLDQSAATWSYHVYHEEFKRAFFVVSTKTLTDEQAIGQYLQKWRKSLDHALNRRMMDLPTYYAISNQLAIATKQWIGGDTANFSIAEVQQLAGLPRRLAVKETGLGNARLSKAYRDTIKA